MATGYGPLWDWLHGMDYVPAPGAGAPPAPMPGPDVRNPQTGVAPAMVRFEVPPTAPPAPVAVASAQVPQPVAKKAPAAKTPAAKRSQTPAPAPEPLPTPWTANLGFQAPRLAAFQGYTDLTPQPSTQGLMVPPEAAPMQPLPPETMQPYGTPQQRAPMPYNRHAGHAQNPVLHQAQALGEFLGIHRGLLGDVTERALAGSQRDIWRLQRMYEHSPAVFPMMLDETLANRFGGTLKARDLIRMDQGRQTGLRQADANVGFTQAQIAGQRAITHLTDSQAALEEERTRGMSGERGRMEQGIAAIQDPRMATADALTKLGRMQGDPSLMIAGEAAGRYPSEMYQTPLVPLLTARAAQTGAAGQLLSGQAAVTNANVNRDTLGNVILNQAGELAAYGGPGVTAGGVYSELRNAPQAQYPHVLPQTTSGYQGRALARLTGQQADREANLEKANAEGLSTVLSAYAGNTQTAPTVDQIAEAADKLDPTARAKLVKRLSELAKKKR